MNEPLKSRRERAGIGCLHRPLKPGHQILPGPQHDASLDGGLILEIDIEQSPAQTGCARNVVHGCAVVALF